MGGDMGRAATGIAYMQEALRLQEAGYAAEVDPRRRSRKALSLAQSLLQVGRQHHQQQDAHEAIQHYLRARDLVEAALRDCVQPSAAGRAEGAARKAIEYARFVLSEVCSSLGVAYNDVGHQEEALTSLEQALSLRKETVGKKHPSVAECLNNLGALYFSRGALQKAVEHYEQALELLLAAADGREEGAFIALTLYNIGLCRAGLGHSREAGAALRRALRTAEQALGSDHRQVELIRETLKQRPPQPGPAQGARQPEAEPGPSPQP